jgi:hypothetical protein
MEIWDESNGDRDLTLLGMPSDSDWVLNGPWHYDDTFIHNAYIDELSRQCGRWAPRTKFVEMFSNHNGGKLDYADYVGVYVLTEKIKSRKARIDITSIEPADNTGEAVTGGYVFKIDRADGDEVNWQTPNGCSQHGIRSAAGHCRTDPQVDTRSRSAICRATFKVLTRHCLPRGTAASQHATIAIPSTFRRGSITTS